MGLLELLQQGQTQLSAGAFPGDTPIYDPQSGFVQSNLSTNTYESETIGQPNNGSALVNTLDNTALDVTNFASTTNITTPTFDWITNYPSLVKGEFNGAPSLYGLAYASENTYLDNTPIQDPDSPQLSTLEQTGLDNTNTNSEPTTIIPNSVSYPNNYPELVSGEFSGAPSPYESPYNVDNTYLSDVSIKDPDSPQLPTLSRTSLDNIDYARENTTSPIPNAGSYPNNYPIVSPQVGMGKFGLQPNQYYSINSYGNGYYYQFNYDNIISTSGNALVAYIPLSGLSVNNNGTAAFVQSPPFNQTYLGNVGFPPFVTGNWGNNPSLFVQPFNAGYNYLAEIPIKDPNSPQTTTLDKTSLDNTDPNNYSGIVPNSISAPNNYPLLVSGEWNGAPLQYASIYNPNSTYLDTVPIQDPNSPQLPTLGETGLDLTNNDSSPTTIVPDNISYPNNYPAIEGVNLGVFNGAPSQYVTLYNSSSTYLNNVPIESENSRQKDTVLSGETALDNTNQQSFSTTTPPNNITSPTTYPVIPQTNLGEFNGAPSQYQTVYTPNSTYLDQYPIVVNEANPQISSLQRTGMDVEDGEYEPTAIFPPNPDTITVYPANVTSNTVNNVGGAPRQFNQAWKPLNRYYNDYIKLLKDQNLV